MLGEVVLDASVAAKLFITEVGSDAARAFALSGVRMIAPDLIFVELANVAVKRLRNGDIPRALAEAIVASAPDLLHEVCSTTELLPRALALASDHGLSAYDATYLALAETRACDLVTTDLRLIARARNARLGILLREP